MLQLVVTSTLARAIAPPRSRFTVKVAGFAGLSGPYSQNIRGKGDRLAAIEVGSWGCLGGVSFDSSRQVLLDPDKHKGRIEVLTLSDRAWHEISVEPGWGDFQDINWASDGKGFFVTSWQPDSYNLLYVTLAGKVKPLLRNGRRQWMVNPWASPDGKWLAYQAQTTDSNVWMLQGF